MAIDEEKGDLDGMTDEEVHEESTHAVEVQAGVDQLKEKLSNPRDGYRPLVPIMFRGKVEGVKFFLEKMRDDDWLNQNAMVFCFDRFEGDHGGKGPRHIAFGLKRDSDFWLNSPEAKKHLRTANITGYPVRLYIGTMLFQFEKKENLEKTGN